MKFNPLKKVILIVATFGMLIGINACKKVDGESTSEPVGKIMQKDTWRMTGYYDDGVDRLANFTGYAFTFNENGTVSAIKDGEVFNGSWAGTQVFSLADSSQVEGFKFEFENKRPFNNLNKNWEVIEKTTKQVHLRVQDLAKGPYDDVFLRINY